MDMLLLILFEEIHKNSETQKANFVEFYGIKTAADNEVQGCED